MSKTFREECIPLITCSQDQNYEVHPDAIKFISSIPSPIGVIGVAGMYRTGKSYLLNRMILDRGDGFGVGSTVNACTKGLWVWGTPLKGQTAKGEPINILVVDSEGIGALDEDSAHDTRIFSLTILISSIFIYNSQGSIDENAIQNLSLVINLTKHIHLNAEDTDEIDPDEYGKFFPSFIWIIRDFTLKLVDMEGNPIDSKQYLENALAQQPGISDDTDNKNRIRRMLTTFFPDRECFTMVRPFTNESELQKLNSMPLDKLRPEFYQQVLSLRKRIMYKMRPKQLKGKNLSGDMFANLILAYTKAINEGSVPNIENAWTYLLQEQAEKAIQESISLYEKEVNEKIIKRMPMSLDNLKNTHKQIKDTVTSFYNEKDLGDAGEIGLKEIEKKMKEKYSELKAMNQKDSSSTCQDFLKKEWTPYERKLKMNEYKNFSEFEKDLSVFHKRLLDHGPDIENREFFFQDFVAKKLSEGASIFLKNMQNELEIQKKNTNELQNQYDKDVKLIKDGLEKEKIILEKKVTQIEKEKLVLNENEEKLKKNNLDLKNEKDRLENEIANQYTLEQNKMNEKIADLTKKLIESDNNLKEKSRNLLQLQSDLEKEKALIAQSSKNLEIDLEEYKKKTRNLEEALQQINSKNNEDTREMTMRYEGSIRTLQLRVSEMEEKISDYEHQTSMKEQQQTNYKENMEKGELNLKNSIKEANKTIDSLMQQIRDNAESESQQLKKMRNEYDSDMEILRNKLNEHEVTLKERSEKIIEMKSTLEKDKAVLQQKLDFAESELLDTKQQLLDLKKAHDSTIKAFEMMQSENKSLITEKDILDMKENHLNEKKQLENELSNQRKLLNSQIESLNEKINEIELKAQLEASDYKKQIDSMQSSLEQNESNRIQTETELKRIESSKLTIIKEIENRYEQRTKGLEDEIEQLKKAHMMEIRLLQSKFEENLRQLKELYESQRELLEKKLIDDRLAFDKKYNNMVEEYELKITEMQTTYEEEISNLKTEIQENELQYQNMIQQYDHELNLKQKSIENLERLLQEAKDTLSKLQENNKQDLEKQIQQFLIERNNFIEKIENLTKDLNNKENELANLLQKYNDLLKNSANKDETIEKLKGDLEKERIDGQNKLDELKKKFQNANSEALEKKIELEKNAALSQQQIEFLNNKLLELQKALEDLTRSSDEKINKLKEDLFNEHNLRMNQMAEEKNNLEQRHEKLKKNAKDNENTNQKRLGDLERERAILNEKNQQLQSRLNDLESRLEMETHHYNLQITQFKEGSEQDKKPLLIDLEKYKALCLQFESEKNEIMALYDKDRALWEAKFNFLEQQREQAKNDLNEAMKKFENTLENLQKARSNEKNQNESTITDMLLSLEKKYQNQINELNEKHQAIIEELEDKIKRLEKELKATNDKFMLETHGKLGNQIMNEKKIAEMIENEKHLLTEIQEVKEDRDKKIKEYQQSYDKDRESLRKKLADLEERLRELENGKSNILFEHEKERAKWNIEKDHLTTEKADLQDNIIKIERKKELLLRENEKLKNDAKNFRKVNNTIIIEKVQKTLNASNQNLGDALKKSGSKIDLNGGGNVTKTITTTSKSSYSNKKEDEENKGE